MARTHWRSPRRRAVVAYSAFAIWGLFVLALTVKTGIQHDYGYYLQQWAAALNGNDPWSAELGFPPNAYGPVHLLQAPFAAVQPLLPKVLCSLAFIGMVGLFVRRLLGVASGRVTWLLFAITLPLNILTMTVVSIFGDNDALVAALVGFSLLARSSRRTSRSGVILGIATLLKFYPLFLIPLFAVDRRRVDWRLVIASAATTAAGLAITFAIWGTAQFQALVFGSSREATSLSPINALRGSSLEFANHLSRFLTEWNTFLVLVGLGVALVISYKFSLSWIESSCIGLFACLVLYKVGHAQFYLTWAILLCGLLAVPGLRARRIYFVFLPFLLFVGLIQFFYYLETQGRWIGFVASNQSVGFATLVLALATFAALFLVLRKHSKNPPIEF